MSRRYEEQVEVRMGRAAEHGVRVEGALPLLSPVGDTGPVRDLQDMAGQDLVEVPTVFLWRGRVHLVRAVLAQWSQRVPWWRAEVPVEGDLERQVWRVEAGAGRAMGTGVYDLVQDDRWWLARVSD